MSKHHVDNKGGLLCSAWSSTHRLALYLSLSRTLWRVSLGDLIEDGVVLCLSKQTIHGQDGIDCRDITYLIVRQFQTEVLVPTKGFESPDHKDRRHSLGRFSCPVFLNYIFVGGLTNFALEFRNSVLWLISPR